MSQPRATTRRARTTCAGVLLGVTMSALSLSPLAASAAAPRVVVDRGLTLPAHVTRVAVPATSSFDLALVPRHRAQLVALLSAVGSPGSPSYRHFLTPAQYGALFSPTTRTLARVTAYFASFGLHTRSLLSSNLVVHVSGPSQAVARAFDARLVAVRANGAVRAQFAGTATLPTTIAGAISGVAGLSTYQVAHHALASSHDVKAHITTPTSCSHVRSLAAGGGVFLPEQQAAGYGLDRQWANNINGAGQSIGVYELANTKPADLATYFNCYGVHAPVTTVNVDGGPGTSTHSGGGNDPNGIEEADLDVEEASVLAPGASVIIYQGFNGGTGPTDTYAAIANADAVSVVTSSWGGCEIKQVAAGDIAAESTIFNQMALQGQSVVAASGDNGSSDCIPDATGLAVDDPASQPTVTGVGGLTINSFASISPPASLSQSVWNNGAGAGGGGLSAYWPQPSWQSGTHVPTTGARMVPDISLMADPGTGFLDYANGSWNSIGGTSIAAPIAGAILVTANQACASRFGSINPTLYAMAASGVGLTDVTSGSNSIPGNGTNNKYVATTGYDPASGLGSPDPATFITALCAGVVSAANSSLTVTPPSNPDVLSGASAQLVLHSPSNQPVANATPTVTATEPGAVVTVTARASTSDVTGTLTYDVTTSAPGIATLHFSLAGTLVATGTVNFTSSLTLSASTLSSLGGPAGSLQVASSGPGELVALNVSATGHLLETSGTAGAVSDLTAKLHLANATGAPALSCAGANCLGVIDSAGHVEVVKFSSNTAVASVVDLSKVTALAAHALSGSLAVVDARTNGYFDVSFLTTQGQCVFVQWNAVGNHDVVTNISSTHALGAAKGTVALQSTSATQSFVAMRVGSTYELVGVGTSHYALNVATWTHFSLTTNGALVSSPVLVRDAGAHHQLELLARTSLGKLVLFGGSGALPNTVVAYQILASNVVGNATIVPGLSGAGDVVLYVSAATLEIAVRNPSWTSLNAANLVGSPLSAPSVGAGPESLITSGGQLYVLTV